MDFHGKCDVVGRSFGNDPRLPLGFFSHFRVRKIRKPELTRPQTGIAQDNTPAGNALTIGQGLMGVHYM